MLAVFRETVITITTVVVPFAFWQEHSREINDWERKERKKGMKQRLAVDWIDTSRRWIYSSNGLHFYTFSVLVMCFVGIVLSYIRKEWPILKPILHSCAGTETIQYNETLSS